MKYKVEIIERMKVVVEVEAKSTNSALAKVEKMYYNDKVSCDELEGVVIGVLLEDKGKRVGKFENKGDAFLI